MIRRRARSEWDKQQRRTHILTTALALWNEQTFAHFSMAELAARCDLAKGTLYLYFQTKEALFLAVLERLLGAWFADLGASLAAADQLDPAAATDLICASLARHPSLSRLLPIAASILEQNITQDVARAYKQQLLNWCVAAGPALESRLRFIAPGDGLRLLMQIYALVVGLGQMADPSPVVVEVLTDPALAALRVTFDPSLRHTLGLILYGLAAERKPGS